MPLSQTATLDGGRSIMMHLSARLLLASVTVLAWAASGIAAGAQQHSFPSGTIRLVARTPPARRQTS